MASAAPDFKVDFANSDSQDSTKSSEADESFHNRTRMTSSSPVSHLCYTNESRRSPTQHHHRRPHHPHHQHNEQMDLRSIRQSLENDCHLNVPLLDDEWRRQNKMTDAVQTKSAPNHHNRSQSVRSAKRSHLLSPPRNVRPRGTSLPGGCEGGGDDCYLLRHFIVNGKMVVNRGDSFRNRRSRSNASVNSSASSIR